LKRVIRRVGIRRSLSAEQEEAFEIGDRIAS
jgi:hypothetical protein